jgi:hypothetical protein
VTAAGTKKQANEQIPRIIGAAADIGRSTLPSLETLPDVWQLSRIPVRLAVVQSEAAAQLAATEGLL